MTQPCACGCGAPVPDGNCLRWQGPHDGHGYGLCADLLDPSGTKRAHRRLWIKTFGLIPEGMVVDHVVARGCRFKDCVNIDHLEVVTNRENCIRGGVKPRIHGNTKKDQCARGHTYDEANTRHYTGKTGLKQRLCRACQKENAKRYRADRKASTTPKD